MNQTYRKLILPAVIAATMLAGTISAQTAPAPDASAPATNPGTAAPGAYHRGPMHRLGFGREMAQKLGLTDEQKAQIKAARQSAGDQIRAIRNDATLTPEDKKARIRSVVQSTKQQMKQVLTPDQQQRFEQLQAEHRAEHATQPPTNQ